MPIDLINFIIFKFKKKIDIEIILDNQSRISNFIEKKINFSDVKITHPKNLNELLICIENIHYGIFMDSGPLHIAKILNKKGILISSSVGQDKLLSDLKSIQFISNNYQSFYCVAPCGLVNILNYNNKIGCYDSLQVSKSKILKHNNLKTLQRGDLKKNYINLIFNPVNCLKNINKKKVIDKIQESITN